ncbi:hypothetical protein CBM2637_A200222 [Cupriavidus taiwanensis]|nr:hypothetical protein CBM2637_A200222 [Cupriavidus taiwanensis]
MPPLLARDGWLTSRAVPDFSSFSVVESCAGTDRRFFFGRSQRRPRANSDYSAMRNRRTGGTTLLK